MNNGVGSPQGSAALSRHVGPFADPLTPSTARFPDGAHFRIEIPSVENPDALKAVVDEARERKVPDSPRVPIGSGAMLLTNDDLREMAHIGADEGIEVNLFVGPREEFGVGGVLCAAPTGCCFRDDSAAWVNFVTRSRTSSAPSTPGSGAFSSPTAV